MSGIIDEMVAKARKAQAQWAEADQERIDAVVREIGKTVYDNAEELARLTVEETRMGTYEDNLRQDKRKSVIIWHSLKGKKTVGVIKRDKVTGLVEIAKPIGVVGAVLPVTIPVTNFMSNSMFAVKCRNAVIGAPHPRAKNTVATTVSLVLKALEKYDLPENLIQYVEDPSVDLTRELMSAVDVVVATGGMGMVKSAYSSGKPAFGVGPGNVQSVIDRGMDIEKTVEKIIGSRTFNLGLPCASEQAIHVHEDDAEKALEAFKKRRVVYIDNEEDIQKVADFIFVDGMLNRKGVGITGAEIAKQAGLDVPDDTVMLLLKGDMREDNFLRREKLCPASLFYTYREFDEAVDRARRNILISGKGHSVAIHSNDDAHIEQLAMAVNVSRIIVNDASNFAAGGSFLNSFGATTTLGTGFWGNTQLHGNLVYHHLMNVTKIGYPPEGARIPTDEEVWS